MVKKVVVIVQARSNSSRLPRKIFEKIGDLNLLQWVDLRLSFCEVPDTVVFALPHSDKFFEVEKYLKHSLVRYVDMPEEDVISRYYNVAKEFKAEIVVRITADCPFIDPKIVDLIVAQFLDSNEKYLSNTNPPSFPDGLDVEVIDFNALKEAYQEATAYFDREHVTPFIIRKYAK